MREFTTLERELITRINSNIADNNFAKVIEPYLEGVNISVDIVNNTATIYLENNDILEDNLYGRFLYIQSLIIQSINLIKLFEDKGYIFTCTQDRIANPVILGISIVKNSYLPYDFPDKKISELLALYSTKVIFVTPELTKFIEDGFIPRDEKRFRKQFRIAIIALSIAISGVLINLFFNIKKESSKEQVFNSNQFDTLLKHIDRCKSIYIDTTIVSNKKFLKKQLDTIQKKNSR